MLQAQIFWKVLSFSITFILNLSVDEKLWEANSNKQIHKPSKTYSDIAVSRTEQVQHVKIIWEYLISKEEFGIIGFEWTIQQVCQI